MSSHQRRGEGRVSRGEGNKEETHPVTPFPPKGYLWRQQGGEIPRVTASSSSSLTPQWRQAGRAKRWQSLSAVNFIPFWLLEFGTAIALFWLTRELIKLAMAFTNDLLVKLPYLEPFQPFYRDPTQSILLTLGILMILSPWLLDTLLRLFYRLQPLPINTLSTYSPEASRVLKRYCQQRNWSLPKLNVLPISAPLALTYGNLPRTARIVVTQGLLEQLADDEIATIYAAQLGYITHGDFVVMSLFILVTQIPYTIYQQVSLWGDRITNEFLRVIAAVFANCAYGLWCLLSGPTLWLSQLRIYYSDRLAAEITGNPNGLTRALLKIAQGINKDIQQQGHTSWLLESWTLLTSVSYDQAIALGSLHSYSQFESVLAWEYLNPARYWLNINNTHPLMGDRLHRLTHIAHHWRLEPELNLASTETDRTLNSSSPPAPPAPPALLFQCAPFFGILFGFVLGGLIWLVGGIGSWLGIAQLAWMYGDWSLIQGCLPIGFSIGTFIQINSLFPDIKPATVTINPDLPNLLASTALPIDSQPIRVQGKLLGRHGISNWLGQDLILHSPTGLVKLHHISWLWPVGDLVLRQSPSPTDLLDRHLTATGWFRRGATPWIDVDILQTQGGKISRSGHPGWSTLLAITAAASGAYIILSGGI